MNDFVASLCTSISPTSLWGVVGKCVPYIGISILMCLGYFLLNKAVESLMFPDRPFNTHMSPNARDLDEEINRQEYEDFERDYKNGLYDNYNFNHDDF